MPRADSWENTLLVFDEDLKKFLKEALAFRDSEALSMTKMVNILRKAIERKARVPGYCLLQFDRLEPCPGGRDAFYINNSISHCTGTYLTPPNPQEYL